MLITSNLFFSGNNSPQDFFKPFESNEVEFTAWWFILGFLFFVLIAYIIGSINSGQLMSKIKKEDLGNVGSGNFGSTNAWRAWGIMGFVLVFIFDVLKAIVAGIILWISAVGFASLANEANQKGLLLSLYMAIPLALVFVSIGHAYPLFFKFKGGKCVATSFGLIIMINWIMAIMAILIFLAIIMASKNMALSSMVGTASGGAFLMFVPFFFASNAYIVVAPWTLTWTIWPAALCTVLIVQIKHIPNILRIINGEELLLK